MIIKMLELSTGHLPPRVRHNLTAHPGHRARPFPGGWLLWVPDDLGPDDRTGWSADPAVLAIQEHARKLGCDWVRFDNDSATSEDDVPLPMFEEDPAMWPPAYTATIAERSAAVHAMSEDQFARLSRACGLPRGWFGRWKGAPGELREIYLSTGSSTYNLTAEQYAAALAYVRGLGLNYDEEITTTHIHHPRRTDQAADAAKG